MENKNLWEDIKNSITPIQTKKKNVKQGKKTIFERQNQLVEHIFNIYDKEYGDRNVVDFRLKQRITSSYEQQKNLKNFKDLRMYNLEAKKDLRNLLFNGAMYEYKKLKHSDDTDIYENLDNLLEKINQFANCYENGDPKIKIISTLASILNRNYRYGIRAFFNIKANLIKVVHTNGSSWTKKISKVLTERIKNWDPEIEPAHLDYILNIWSEFVQSEEKRPDVNAVWSTAPNHFMEQSWGASGWTSCHEAPVHHYPKGQNVKNAEEWFRKFGQTVYQGGGYGHAFAAQSLDFVSTILLIDRKPIYHHNEEHPKYGPTSRVMIYINTKNKIWTVGTEYPTRTKTGSSAWQLIYSDWVKPKMKALGFTEVHLGKNGRLGVGLNDTEVQSNRTLPTAHQFKLSKYCGYNDYSDLGTSYNKENQKQPHAIIGSTIILSKGL